MRPDPIHRIPNSSPVPPVASPPHLAQGQSRLIKPNQVIFPRGSVSKSVFLPKKLAVLAAKCFQVIVRQHLESIRAKNGPSSMACRGAFFNPNGIASSSPGLARFRESLPWVSAMHSTNPERVGSQSLMKNVQPFQGCLFSMKTAQFLSSLWSFLSLPSHPT
jgi:hypothetical protein